MLVESCLLSESTIFIATVSAHGNQHWPAPEIGTNSPGNLITIHPRQADVEQNNIGMIFTDDGNPGRPIICDDDFMSEQSQKFGQALRSISIIVHNDHPERASAPL